MRNNGKKIISIVAFATSLLFVSGFMIPRQLLAVTLSVPTGLTGFKGSTVQVPVNIDTPLDLNKGYLIDVIYDSSILDYDGFAPAVYPSAHYDFDDNEDPNGGRVTIGGYIDGNVVVNGALFVTKFNVLSESENSAISLVNKSEIGHVLYDAKVRAGSITTTAITPACTISAIVDLASKPGGVHDIILSLTGYTISGDTARTSRIWNESDSNVVSFDVEQGTYRIKAESIGYAPYYSDLLDCDTNTAYVTIDEKLMPSYSVDRQDIVTDPNKPEMKFTFKYTTGTGVEDDWPEWYPLRVRFFDSTNDSDHDEWPDPNTIPNGPVIDDGLNRVDGPNGYKVYTVTIPVKNYLMADLSDSYVIAFRTERWDAGWTDQSGEVFLDPNGNEKRIHRFIVKKSQLSESTKVVASGAVTLKPKADLAAKGYITIQADPDIVISQTESLTLVFDAKGADIFHFTRSSDANSVVASNENLGIGVSYTTGAGAGLTAGHPGVKDPNDIIVVSVEFTDQNGKKVVYNQDRERGVSLIFFDIPAPRALQDPNLTLEAIEDKILTRSKQIVTPDNYYGIYFIHGESEEPELFIPNVHGGSLNIFKQNGVNMLNIGVPHASDWYIGEYTVSPTGKGGGGCFIQTVIKNVSTTR
ncbi:MAG: cohesin domain-containing protein [bacterium]